MRLLLVSLVLATPLLCNAAQPASQKPDRELIPPSCTRCHDSAKTCAGLGKDEAWWTATVRRMCKYGAGLSDKQVLRTAHYLSSLKPGDDAVCP